VIRTIVCGAAGRMGGRIVALMQGTGDLVLAGAVERTGHPAVGKDVGEVAGIGAIGVPAVDDLRAVIGRGQAVIDFTAPEAAMLNLGIAAQARVPMVIGTTGLSAADLSRARGLTATIPCVLAPNMSVGVNVLFRVLADVASSLGSEYDVEVFEAHHRFKKDAPSGTALRMAQVIASALGRDLEQVGTYGRRGLVGERRRDEIAIHALRAGDVVGEHTVVFGGLGERVEVTHRAHSRDTFAMGALRAVRWVVDQPPGLYDMQDVLGLSGRP
jgi:4-hydroxy-tetrahydrodipicolinate reductase